jgi:hypothetical protein
LLLPLENFRLRRTQFHILHTSHEG